MKIVGLDIGTTTISGVLMDTEKKTLLGSKTIPNGSAVVHKMHIWQNEQDPERIWEACCELLNFFSGQFSDIDGIGLTGQMHGLLYVDAAGKALGNLVTWQDARGNQSYKVGATYCEYLESATGYPMATGYGLTTHFYNLSNNLVPEKAVSCCTIMDYVAMRLCGLQKPVTHASNAASFGLFDVRKQQFDLEALSLVGMLFAILPEVVPGEKIVGYTQDAVPVCIPIGDNQASFLGSVNAKSNLLVNIGTSSQISLMCDRILETTSLEYRPFVGGAYLLVGSGLCGGSAYQLIRDFFSEVLQLFGNTAVDDLYARMELAAKDVMGADNQLLIDTRFRGTRKEPGIRGAIQNIDVDNLTPGNLVSGVLVGICHEMKSFFNEIPLAYRGAEVLVGSGNAIRKNGLLRKALSETFEKVVVIPKFEEEASLGAALLAASVIDESKGLAAYQDLIVYE